MQSQADNKRLSVGELFALSALAGLAVFDVRFTSSVLAVELFAVIYVACQFFGSRSMYFTRHEKILVALGIGHLLFQITSDIVNASSVEDWSRGIARVTFSLINFTFFARITNENKSRTIVILILFSLARLISILFVPDAFNALKVGVGPNAAVIVIALLSLFELGRRYGAIIFLMSVGVAVMIFNARNLGANLVVCSALLILSKVLGDRVSGRWQKTSAHMALLPFLIFLVGVIKFYEYSAESGFLGEAVQQKAADERATGLGVFFGARKDLYVTAQAIADKPILGHGSWPNDVSGKYIGLLVELGYKGGSDARDDFNYQLGKIPNHSFVAGAWMEAGFAGAMYWIYVLYLVFAILVRSVARPDRYSALIIYISLVMGWDIVFSPYGYDRRVLVPLYIITLIRLDHASKNTKHLIPRRRQALELTAPK
jgi:hypothetical protein